MRALVQRVSRASVRVGGEVKGSIGPGLLVLLGAGHEDRAEDAEWLARKVAHLRVFGDDRGQMNRDLLAQSLAARCLHLLAIENLSHYRQHELDRERTGGAH